MKQLLIITTIIASTCLSLAADNKTVFQKVKTKNGLLIEIPRNWSLFGKKRLDAISASTESIIELGKIKDTIASSLLHATYKDGDIYGACRLAELKSDIFTEEVVDLMTSDPEILNQLGTKMIEGIKKSYQPMGIKIISSQKAKAAKIMNKSALMFQYTRSSVTGGSPVVVTQYHFPYPDGIKQILTISYSKKSELLMKPIILKIKNSLTNPIK